MYCLPDRLRLRSMSSETAEMSSSRGAENTSPRVEEEEEQCHPSVSNSKRRHLKRARESPPQIR